MNDVLERLWELLSNNVRGGTEEINEISGRTAELRAEIPIRDLTNMKRKSKC